MGKRLKEIFIIIFIILLCIGLFIIYNGITNNGMKELITNRYFIIYLIIMLLFIVIFWLSSFVFGKSKTKELHHRDKLFNSLVQNSDTIYAMYDVNKREYIYTTNNAYEVLGIKEDEKETNQIINQIFEIPVLKNELEEWNQKSEFVSQMLAFKNPAYQHTRWIKVKIYPFRDKKLNYNVILISDVTKEHDQQHLLVTQAADIKTREKQLNEITSVSYDIEIDVNVSNNEMSLHNLKPEFSYFGNEKNGNYETEMNNIIDTYILKNDRNNVKNLFSRKRFLDILETKNFEPISVRYRLIDDNIIWLESTAFFTTNKGELHVTILTKNVTENAEYMREQNQLLQNALKDSKKANKAKSEFLAIMSHEIRTPMNAIIGLSSSILNEDLPKDVREDIENINSASMNLLDVIDGILDISKIESGKETLVEKEYNVPKFLKDLENITNENIGNKEIKLNLVIDPKTPAKLFGESSRIRQVLNNILNNSIKFTDKGSITIKVDSKKKNNTCDLIISISDTGCGIEKDKLSRLFDESKKVTNDNSKYIEGMGLTITKKLMDLLNGQIDVESTVGVGTTFTIIVNQKLIDDKVIGDINEYVISKKKNSAFDTEGKKVLVVDDNKLNLKVAERLLKPYNVEITTVDSGIKTLELINNGSKFDLILLDQMMPEMDGTETLHNLKNIKGFDIPVIMLTADAIVGKREEYLKAGFDDYLSKPIDTNELNKVLKKFLQN